jgi:opacity protein-like surface antigen
MKKLINKIGSITLIMLLAIHFAFAGDKTKVGTVGGVQLLVPVGARSIAMGQAIVADIGGAEALYWNPAGISSGKTTEFVFSNMSYIADINVNYFGAVYYGGNYGSIGLFLKSFDFGDIPETTENMPDGTGRTFSPTYLTAGFAYARSITNLIDAGFTLKYIYEGIEQTNASTIALDLGVQYKLNDNLKLGVVMNNVGGKLQYDGRNLENQYPITNDELSVDDGYFRGVTLASNIPSLFTFGVAYKREIAEGSMIKVNGAFNSINEYSDQLGLGLEYAYNDMIFLRAGYTSDYQADSDAQLFDYRLGAGLKLKMGNFKIIADYTYMNVKKYFDSMNIFSVKIGL